MVLLGLVRRMGRNVKTYPTEYVIYIIDLDPKKGKKIIPILAHLMEILESRLCAWGVHGLV